MKLLVKNIIKKTLGQNLIDRLIKFRVAQMLKKNYRIDYVLYKKNSSVFNKNSFEKKESEITLRYHSIEKGFLHSPIRPRFAIQRVIDLLPMMRDEEVIRHTQRVQIQATIACLCNYYEMHQELSVDISDYFTNSDYEFLKKHLEIPMSSVKYHNNIDYFSKINDDFYNFSNSRCSVRSFTGEKVPVEIVREVINLANNAPSVCNRQPATIILVESKPLIDKILEIQGGVKGYSEKVNQLIVVTCNRNYFYSVGERNQLYVDGGIYLMNLLYALHYYKIATCPAHWGMPVEEDEKMRNILHISDAFQIISLVVIGVPTDEFKTTLSLRKTHEENLIVVN